MSAGIDRALLLRAAALVLGGAVAGLGANALHPAGVALQLARPASACGGGETGIALVEMDAAEVADLCGRSDVVFADTRPAADFAAGHVAGAVHLPCDSSARAAEEASAQLGLASTVIIYGADTADARAVAQTLRRNGLDVDLRVLRGGFPAWEAQGLACAAGPCPDCALAGVGAPLR